MTNSTSFAGIQNLSAALVDLVASVAPNVVAIHSGRSRSSGFIWRPGLIVTADEALSEEDKFIVTLSGGDTVEAHLVGRDPTTDVALLRVEADVQQSSLTASTVVAGALVVAVGAEEDTSTVALGVVSRVSGPWRSLRGGDIDARVELDMRLRKSAEGCLVLGAGGDVIGMAVFGPRRRVLVIPTATIERVAPKLASNGRIARGYLGVGLQPVTIEGGEGSGVMVMSVDPQGPGALAGLHQGDILVAWNGEPIRHVHSLLRALGPDSVGQTVTLRLRRAGDTRQVPLTIAERPAA
jgi:S1-C subfamily serine protease